MTAEKSTLEGRKPRLKPKRSGSRASRSLDQRLKGIMQRFDYNHTTRSVMIRGLDGSIYFWNRAAEHNYGYQRHQAVGNVSHHLLETVFPCPLTTINEELLAKGFWEGELIHTLSDGARVKVMSRWELQPQAKNDPGAVVEINEGITPIGPETAYLVTPQGPFERVIALLARNKFFWLTPMLLIFGLYCFVLELSQEGAIVPLLD